MGIYAKEEQYKLIKDDWRNLEKIDNQYEEVCLEAVKNKWYALEFVKEQTEEICLKAVKKNGCAIRDVKNQTLEICLEAVKENGYALKYVKEQTNEICLEAVKEEGLALQYVKNQMPEICLAAIDNNAKALKYVKEQTVEICLDAVRIDKKTFDYVVPKLIPSVSFNLFLECYNVLFLNDVEKFIRNKNKIENNIFVVKSIDYIRDNNDYRFLAIESLMHLKDFLIKENSNNVYILEDVFSCDVLDLLKELALSNNELIIIDTGHIKDIHTVLANKIIKKGDFLYKNSF